MGARFSVIIPTLNEARTLTALLPALRRDFPNAEIIVADGGSADDTIAVAHARDADHVLITPRGRAAQMNAGASVAKGEVLWFLHADSAPPCDALAQVEKILASGFCGGCFRVWFDESVWYFRISDAFGNFLTGLTGIAYGDHGIFCTAEAFHRVGGYPSVPIFEDADFYRALRRWGGVRQAPAHIFTSARRYLACGPWRTTLIYILLTVLYVIGCPHRLLALWHGRLMPLQMPEEGKRAPCAVTSREH